MRHPLVILVIYLGLLDFSGLAGDYFVDSQSQESLSLSKAHDHQSCNDSNAHCASNHCHFGHCTILPPAPTVGADESPNTLSILDGRFLKADAYLLGLFRPPIV